MARRRSAAPRTSPARLTASRGSSPGVIGLIFTATVAAIVLLAKLLVTGGRWYVRTWQRSDSRGRALLAGGLVGGMVLLCGMSAISTASESPPTQPRRDEQAVAAAVATDVPPTSSSATPTRAPRATAVTPTAPTPEPTQLPATSTEVSLTGTGATIGENTAGGAPATIAGSQATDMVPARVVNIVDGDTVDVLIDGREERLRLIGIDTPETVAPQRPVECFGREASEQARALLEDQEVLLEADPSQDERDRYGRLLRYVWLPDGRLFNQEMVAQGYAFEYTYDLPYKYQAEFRLAQQTARQSELGLWSPTTCAGEQKPAEVVPEALPAAQPQPTPVPVEPSPVPPTPEPPPPPTPEPQPAEACDPSYPDICIPLASPDLDCPQIPYRRFRVVGADPHRFDGDNDGIGCER
jgi:endonuclease YncB( thermonuclease family)